jgi:hypothetical protein
MQYLSSINEIDESCHPNNELVKLTRGVVWILDGTQEKKKREGQHRDTHHDATRVT